MKVHRLPGPSSTEKICGTMFENPTPDMNSPVPFYTCTCEDDHPEPHVAHAGGWPVAIAFEEPGDDAGAETEAADQAGRGRGGAAKTCCHCQRRKAEKEVFTTLIRTGNADVTKSKLHVCAACAAEAARWLDAIGLVVTNNAFTEDWDAVIEDIPDGKTSPTP